jgi:hypothetical protein
MPNLKSCCLHISGTLDVVIGEMWAKFWQIMGKPKNDQMK